MPRKPQRPRPAKITALRNDPAFADELASILPYDAALLAGIQEYDGLGDDLRAAAYGQRRSKFRIPLVLRVSTRLAALLLGDGAKLYALSDPWAFLNMLRTVARRSRQ